MEQKKMRCHISVVLENAGSLLGVLLAIGISQIDDVIKMLAEIDERGAKIYLIGIGVFILVLALVLLFHLNLWYKTLIWIENGTLMVERNTLNKKKNAYVIKNISNIDMEQNLLERVLGTYKIKIDTNSAALAEKTDIKILFSKAQAMELKKQLYSFMNQSDAVTLEEDTKDFSVEYSTKDILLNCFYDASLFSIIILIGVFIFTFQLGIKEGKSLTDILLSNFRGGIFAVLIATVSAVSSLVKGFFKFYGFKAKRDADKIYIHYGLIRKRMATLPVDKINGVILKQPFFSRIFKKYQLQVINIGTGDEKNESSNLLLSCSLDEVKKYMSVLLPEYEDFIQRKVKRQSLKYLLHMAIFLVIEFFVFAVIYSFVAYFWKQIPISMSLVMAILMTLCLFLHLSSYLAAGYYIGEDYLVIAEGVFTRTSSMIHYEKIQHVQVIDAFATRITGLKKPTVFILATLLDSAKALPLMEEKSIEKVIKKAIEV